MERCIGCHSCSLACARLVHKNLSWDTVGIRIASSGGLSTGFEARTCVACDPAPCAEACPTRAIAFGNLHDPQSEVAKLAKDPRAFRILAKLHTEPKVYYLSKYQWVHKLSDNGLGDVAH